MSSVCTDACHVLMQTVLPTYCIIVNINIIFTIVICYHYYYYYYHTEDSLQLYRKGPKQCTVLGTRKYLCQWSFSQSRSCSFCLQHKTLQHLAASWKSYLEKLRYTGDPFLSINFLLELSLFRPMVYFMLISLHFHRKI